MSRGQIIHISSILLRSVRRLVEDSNHRAEILIRQHVKAISPLRCYMIINSTTLFGPLLINIMAGNRSGVILLSNRATVLDDVQKF